MGIFKKHKNTKPTNTWNANTINKLIQPVTCGPECQKAQRDETLRRSYDQSLLNMKEAPDKVKVAEKEYYISMNGSEFYNNVLKDRYTTEISDESSKIIDDQKNNLTTFNSIVNDYDVSNLYIKRITDLMDRLVLENTILNTKIDRLSSNVTTNDRKTYYEEQQINYVGTWKTYILYIYWLLFIVYCAVALILKNKILCYKTWIKILILSLVPMIVFPLLKKFILFKYYKNIK
jgi:hypothetical protein